MKMLFACEIDGFLRWNNLHDYCIGVDGGSVLGRCGCMRRWGGGGGGGVVVVDIPKLHRLLDVWEEVGGGTGIV
jgi:hypothetical protein